MTTTEKLNQSISDTLREARNAKGMTLNEFCSFLDIPYKSYWNYENGLQQPTIVTIIAICDKLEIGFDDMIGF